MHVTNEVDNTFPAERLSSLGGHSAHAFVKATCLSNMMQYGFAAIGLVLLAPLFLAIALLIKLTSPGPILYRGLRVGKDARIFIIYKFRTLQVGAEEKIGARLLNERDTYYTCLGKFLKRAKLDELPQLVNVLKGEMNIVGPRPIRPIFLEQLCDDIPHYPIRFAVKPGMTGLAQVRGGYFTHPRDKLRYDLLYIRNRSLLLDLKLIALTFVGIPKEFSYGPFAAKHASQLRSSRSNSPATTRIVSIVDAETSGQPSDGHLYRMVSQLSWSAEDNHRGTLGISNPRQIMACVPPHLKP
jgi:lipopolysaccharide/colanic/teichoic acid biosynthesis glycosyltransferase